MKMVKDYFLDIMLYKYVWRKCFKNLFDGYHPLHCSLASMLRTFDNLLLVVNYFYGDDDFDNLF